MGTPVLGQINTERVMSIGRNALQFEDYVLSNLSQLFEFQQQIQNRHPLVQ
ncbi:MAG: hypothetical protein IKK16_00240 [Bacteroidaceae bacterium]|nr:hypothetical protein [Bacteroidaceae bacterium]